MVALLVRIVGGALAIVGVLSLSGAAMVTVPPPQEPPRYDEIDRPAGIDEAERDDSPITSTVASVSEVEGGEVPVGLGGLTDLSGEALGIPKMVLEAYQRAAQQTNVDDPACHIRWQILAGIGKVESNHAAGGQLKADGTTRTPILGPVLSGGGVASIGDHDGGLWDGDATWDRAVGPMQFIPGTWKAYGADGSSDGVPDPHNIYDATLAAAQYLCAGDLDLATSAGLTGALLRYNNSMSYVATVMSWISLYDSGRGVSIDGIPSAQLPPALPPADGRRPTSGPGDDNDPRTPDGSPSDSPSDTPTGPGPTKTASHPPDPTPSETQTPDPTPTDDPTQTPDPTPTGDPTESPDPTPTPTPTPTDCEDPTVESDPDEPPGEEPPDSCPTETPSPSPSPTGSTTDSPDPTGSTSGTDTPAPTTTTTRTTTPYRRRPARTS